MRTHRYLPRIVVAYVLFAFLLVAGLGLQWRWDAQCDRLHPGTRWDGEIWACSAR